MKTKKEFIEIYKPDMFIVQSTRTNQYYVLIIMKEKMDDFFRIVNISKKWICPCVFHTYEEAVSDIFRYQEEGKNKIIISGDFFNMAQYVYKGYTINTKKENWLK